jgi:two-component system sensor histidine kinase CpxA
VKSLFWRILLWFCAGSAMVFIAVGVGLWTSSPDALATAWWQVGRGALVSAGRTAVEIRERDGELAARRYLERFGRDTGVVAELSNGLAGEPLDQLGVAPLRGRADVTLRGASGRSYTLSARLPRRAARGVWSRTFMLIYFCVSAVLCFLLARHLSAPIAHLRALTARFASGDLAARVQPPELLERRDEVGGLARDFDQMAARLESLVNAQRRLIGDVSHELRSPLTRLSLALGLVRREGGVAPASLGRMEREVERLNGMVEQLLELSRLEALAAPPPFERIDLNALVGSIVVDADFEASCVGRGVRLDNCMVCTVRGAEALLRSAVENVVRNAVRYTQEGTWVVVNVTRALDAPVARVAVSDRGPGVEDADLPRIFEPFYRAESARERQSGGAGLGLAITARVVELHGGTVHAANGVEGGLVIQMELPLAGGDNS